MPANKKSAPSEKKSISIHGNVTGNDVIIGDNNTVNKTTIIQKFFNIFKSDAETLEQRNCRILLGHVENAWIKGVLDASLYGAAMLDLGIKETPEAITNKYPWAIKKESTDETLPVGTSMLEIFDTIGMGRSLLILGTPGSGKTTMLLELTRQLIERARTDVTESIPMVFNLASWTEKLTLADWLAQELNNLYSVPRKTAPDWVKGDKLLLLLDGLDEVRQESRTKCVDAINEFRKEHGLTSLAVCSRSQDYADLNAKLSFEGAIEVQPLTQKQITEFFNRFGKEMAGIKQVLKKDSTLREMAETPLFLSIMIMAYQDKQDVDILISQDEKAQRKHLFDNYIERMLKSPRIKSVTFKRQDVSHWLSWLSIKMAEHSKTLYFIDTMQHSWLGNKETEIKYKNIFSLILGALLGLTFGAYLGLMYWKRFGWESGILFGTLTCLFVGWIFGRKFGLISVGEIQTVEILAWDIRLVIQGVLGGILYPFFGQLIFFVLGADFDTSIFYSNLSLGVGGGILLGLFLGLKSKQLTQISYPEERLFLSAKNFLLIFLVLCPVLVVIFSLGFEITKNRIISVLPFNYFGIAGLGFSLIFGLIFGGITIIQHYVLRFLLASNNLLPWRLVPFLNHCVDLIFLRRVGGGYIFVHRLLMEHFAEMYVETNQN